MKFFIPLFFLALLIFSPPAAAQDSIDYMMDGVMTQEEMNDEAQGVFRRCVENVFQGRYFNCECIAGSFLQERERQGPFIPQEDILMALYREGEKYKCGNTERIAVMAYSECLNYTRYFRSNNTNNKQYCECTGNKIAKDFSAHPHISQDYISRLHVDAMLHCEQVFPKRGRR